MISENISSAGNQQERVPNDVERLKYYLAGFTDGEGCFSVTICRSRFARLGWKMDPLFQVYQHKDNDRVLYLFKDVLKCGYVSKKGGNPLCHVFCVDKIFDLIEFVIPFFNHYLLIGEKYNDFVFFSKIVEGISKKKHLEKSGFLELTNFAFCMNSKGRFRRNPLGIIEESLEQSSEAKRQTRVKAR